MSGLLARGSFVTGEMDAESDLDLAVLTEGSARSGAIQSMASRAELLGKLLACFSGEHVGQPELLICLHGPPAVRVDLPIASTAWAGHHPAEVRSSRAGHAVSGFEDGT